MREEIRQVREGLRHLYRAPFLEEPEMPFVQPILDELGIRVNDVIVELGAGKGLFTLPIARRLDTLAGRGVVFVCDYSESLLESLEQKVIADRVDEHVRPICLDKVKPKTLPFKDEQVDIVLAVNFLQYMEGPVPYLQEVFRILAPCGNLLIVDWQNKSNKRLLKSEMRVSKPDDIYLMLEKEGFDTHLQLYFDGINWAIRGVKPVIIFI